MQEEVVEAEPEVVVHEDNEWGISLVDEDLGDPGTHGYYNCKFLRTSGTGTFKIDTVAIKRIQKTT